MSQRILGRAAELEQVGALLADEAPEARSLALTGDAGVGKTTTCEEGVRLAGERGLRVLAARPARCWTRSRPGPRRSSPRRTRPARSTERSPAAAALRPPGPPRRARPRRRSGAAAQADHAARQGGQDRRAAERHRYALPFRALTAGTGKVEWYRVLKGGKRVLIATGRHTFGAAGRNQLRRAKHLALTAKGTFTLPHAAPVTAKRTFTLRR